jgi:hypothetical protein
MYDGNHQETAMAYFTLSCSLWDKDKSIWIDVVPSERGAFGKPDLAMISQLHQVLNELDNDQSLNFHPRAQLYCCDTNEVITAFRSGRVERGMGGSGEGYERTAWHCYLTRKGVMEVWMNMLFGRSQVNDTYPWVQAADTHCPVCGNDVGEAPWGDDLCRPSYSICHCCACEFGANDRSFNQVNSVREDWIAKGCFWLFDRERPVNWDPIQQLKMIPTDRFQVWESYDRL